MKDRVFWFHYNKPESRKTGEPRLTVHYAGKCHIVRGIDCGVPTFSHNRKDQPHCVIKGRGVLEIREGIAIIRKSRA